VEEIYFKNIQQQGIVMEELEELYQELGTLKWIGSD